MAIKILAEELLICSHQVLRSYFTAFEVFDTKRDIRPTSTTPGKGKSVQKNKLTWNIEEIPQEQIWQSGDCQEDDGFKVYIF